LAAKACYVEGGQSIEAISICAKKSPAVIRRWLKEAGIPMRNTHLTPAANCATVWTSETKGASMSLNKSLPPHSPAFRRGVRRVLDKKEKVV